MGVYLEPHDRTFVVKKLAQLDKSKKVAIIGCAACANMSRSSNIENPLPIRDIAMKPVALNVEMDALAKDLSKDHELVKRDHIMAMCSYSDKKEKKIRKIAKDADAVVVLSCAAGIQSVELALGHKNVVAGMKLKGFKPIRLKVKKGGLYAVHQS